MVVERHYKVGGAEDGVLLVAQVDVAKGVLLVRQGVIRKSRTTTRGDFYVIINHLDHVKREDDVTILLD